MAVKPHILDNIPECQFLFILTLAPSISVYIANYYYRLTMRNSSRIQFMTTQAYCVEIIH